MLFQFMMKNFKPIFHSNAKLLAFGVDVGHTPKTLADQK